MKCHRCNNAIFKEEWGEYKCQILKRTVKIEDVKKCRKFKAKKKESK